MSEQFEVQPNVITVGSTLRHRNLRDEHTVLEISENAVRTSCAGQEYVYPRNHLAAELSAGRFELVSN